jgi:GxxExxY protein
MMSVPGRVVSAIPRETEAIAKTVVDAGYQIHIALGPGLLESTYERCLAFEIEKRGLVVQRQVALPVVYEDVHLEAGYRIDLLVGERVVVEVKSVDVLAPIHQAQLLTYLKLSGRKVGFLMNFNVPLFKDGLRRFVRS